MDRGMRQILLLVGIAVVVVILSHLYSKLYNTHSGVQQRHEESAATYTSKSTVGRITEPPNMIVLQRLKVFQEITRNDAINVGTILLQDETGNKIKGITDATQNTEDINREIFRRWLNGKWQKPTNWDTLITVLRDVKLYELSEQLEKSVAKEFRCVPSFPYAHSEVILNGTETLKEKYKAERIFVLTLGKQRKEIPYFDLVMKGEKKDSEKPCTRNITEVLKDFEVKRELLIIGQPGSGKTILIKHLAKMWAKGELLQYCQILFVLQLGDHKGEYQNLSDLLNKAYKDYGIPFEEIVQKNGEGACLLMDAFDEKVHKHDYVYKLMYNNELPLSRRILTSRPNGDLIMIGNSVELVGFENHKLDCYLNKLSTNKTAKAIIRNMWKDKYIKELCQLPLHLTMIVLIANNTHTPFIKSTTQLYAKFMNATIVHYKYSHPEWDMISLRECIVDKHNITTDKLCNAFKNLHYIAFEMTINNRETFALKVEIQTEINKLGFVSILKDNPLNGEVKIIFSHPTFEEFFAAIHLLTLTPKNEELIYLQNSSLTTRKFLVIMFYFGLLGDFYMYNSTAVAIPLRHYTVAKVHPILKDTTLTDSTENICPNGVIGVHSSTSLLVHKEIGWTGHAYVKLLKSTGIVVNSSACVVLTPKTISSLIYLLEHAHVWTLSIINHYCPSQTASFHHYCHPLHPWDLQDLESFYDGGCPSVEKEIQWTVHYYHWMHACEHTIWEQYYTNLVECFNAQSFGYELIHPHYNKSFDNSKASNVSRSIVDINGCDMHMLTLLHTFSYITTLTMRFTSKCTVIFGKPTERIINAGLLLYPDKLQKLTISEATDINISTFLSGLTSLKYLRIEYQVINKTAADQIIAAVDKDLLELDLFHCYLTEYAVKLLAEKFHLFPKLRNLYFDFSSLTDSDVITLSEHIKHLHSLSHLGLAHNKINGESIPALVRELKTIETFRSLNLYGNSITGDENIQSIAYLTTLHSLQITVRTKEDMDTIYATTKSISNLVSFLWSDTNNNIFHKQAILPGIPCV